MSVSFLYRGLQTLRILALGDQKVHDQYGSIKRTVQNNSVMCHSLWRCARPILLWQWNSEKRKLLWIMRHLREKWLWKLPCKCIFPAWWCFTTNESWRQGLFRDIFRENWIGKFGPENWPARWPDITPPDIFSWGYVRNRVFKTSVNSVTQLIRRTTGAIRSMTQEIINKV